jgi:hypothetical protein
MKTFGVSGLPLLKEKTGKLHAMFLALESRNLASAERGQQLLFFIWKMSMKSPCGFFCDFGKRMLIIAELCSVKWIRFQVKVSHEPFE